ncbi:MAG: hypothetical protein QOC94_3505 [Actinoplanes sp.]|nr:hypothetical protein [Actinoplanes sp.]
MLIRIGPPATGILQAVGEALVRVRFELVPDEDGWPPVTSEGLWATIVGGNVVRLQNAPWFAREVANGDLLRVRPGEDGQLWAGDRVRWSGRCAIRVVPFRDGAGGGGLQWVLDLFEPLQVSGEGIEQFGLVALDVPAGCDLSAVKYTLIRGEQDGWWQYEEGCVGAAWMEAGV